MKGYKSYKAAWCIYINQSIINIVLNNTSMLREEKSQLSKRFAMTVQCEVFLTLGITLQHDRIIMKNTFESPKLCHKCAEKILHRRLQLSKNISCPRNKVSNVNSV